MNDVKKELLKVAGDMTSSKAHIKERVLHQHDSKPKKPFRFIVMSAVVTVCLVGFIVVQLLNGDLKRTTQLFNYTQFTYFEDMERIMWFNPNEEPEVKSIYASYEQKMASYYFAKSLGFETTSKELKAEKASRYKEFQILNEVPKYAEIFQDKDFEKYFEVYIDPLVPMFVAEKQLEKLYQEKYPTFPKSMVRDIAEQDAIRYFNTHFAEEALSFQEELGLEHYVNIPRGSTFVGMVVEVADNAFLFVEGAVPEDMEQLAPTQIIDKYNNATWYPLEDDVSVKIGDYAEVSSSSSVSENSNIERYGLLQSMTILDPFVTTKLVLQNTSDVAQFLQQLGWEKGETSIVRPPDYSFKIQEVRVDVWITHAKTIRLHSLEFGDAKLGDKSSQQLKGLLGI